MTRPMDIAGMTFGFLTVIERRGSDKRGQALWLCKCACGNFAIKSAKLMKRGETKTCGCRTGADHTINPGMKFGRLLIEDGPALDSRGRKSWRCICDCGTSTTVTDYQLWSGHTRSCGCLSKELHLTHGDSDTKLYHVWESMKGRCYTKGHTSFKNYGTKGISVCQEWRDSYEVFKVWALSHGYEEGLQLDRVENSGDYSPGNCQFITPRANLIKKPIKAGRNKTGFAGVAKSNCAKRYGRDEWYAQITVNGKVINLMGYMCPESAAIARDIYCAANNLGYSLNFPELAVDCSEEKIKEILMKET